MFKRHSIDYDLGIWTHHKNILEICAFRKKQLITMYNAKEHNIVYCIWTSQNPGCLSSTPDLLRTDLRNLSCNKL